MDLLDAAGDGTLLYASGRTAVTVCRGTNGYFHTFIADSAAFQVLCNFDPEGVGSVTYANGRPWLVTTSDGWMLCDSRGSIQDRGSWPWCGSQPVICEVTPELRVTFAGRDSISAHFSCAGVQRCFQVGRQLRRHAGLAVLGADDKGQTQLDVAAIRQRIATIGSVYVPPGPHHATTPQPGMGNLRSLVARMAPEGPLAATMRALDCGQARLAGLAALRAPPRQTRAGTAAKALPAAAPAALPDDRAAPYGSPVLSQGQRRIAARLQRAAAGAPAYTMRRRKLPLLDMRALERLTGPGAPPDTLIVVAVLASWNPVCTRLEHYELQAAAWALAQQAGGGEGAPALGCDAARVRLFKVDGSGCSELRRRHGAFVVPMFFFWYGGRLVKAGNAVRRCDELLAAAADALAAGRRGASCCFASGLRADALDSISPDMSLRGGA